MTTLTFIRKKRQEIEADTLSLDETADMTGLDPMVLGPAAEMGLFEAVERDGRTRITADSIARFSANYVPLASLAKELKTLPQHLWRFCKQNGFETIVVARSHNGVPTPILPLARKEALVAAWRQARHREVREPQPKREETYEAAMRTYLQELEAHRKMLPRRAGSPNKAVIARACGFHRDVLYSYPNVIALLDAHDQAEHAASQRWLEKS